VIFHTPVFYDAVYDHNRPSASKCNGIISGAQLRIKQINLIHVLFYSQRSKMKRLHSITRNMPSKALAIHPAIHIMMVAWMPYCARRKVDMESNQGR
jgi:hypothetical protein